MKLVLGKVQANNLKINQFKADYAAAISAASKKQQELLSMVVGRIKQHLQSDPRPSYRDKFPWKNHTYTGDLLDSVHQTTKVVASGVIGTIGYGVDHGTTLEPEAILQNNLFVPKNWGNNYKKILVNPGGEKETIPRRDESFDSLYEWAYDIITRRTIGKKLRVAAAKSTAKRWAINLQKMIEMEGQRAYPIIVPMMELLFSGELTGQDTFADEIFSVVSDKLKMREDEGEVPF